MASKRRPKPRKLGRRALFRLVCQEAYRDGTAAGPEKEILERLQLFLRLEPLEAAQIAGEAKKAFQDGEYSQERPLHPALTFQEACRIAWEDGVLHNSERQLLIGLANLLGLEAERARRTLEETRPEGGEATPLAPSLSEDLSVSQVTAGDGSPSPARALPGPSGFSPVLVPRGESVFPADLETGAQAGPEQGPDPDAPTAEGPAPTGPLPGKGPVRVPPDLVAAGSRSRAPSACSEEPLPRSSAPSPTADTMASQGPEATPIDALHAASSPQGDGLSRPAGDTDPHPVWDDKEEAAGVSRLPRSPEEMPGSKAVAVPDQRPRDEHEAVLVAVESPASGARPIDTEEAPSHQRQWWVGLLGSILTLVAIGSWCFGRPGPTGSKLSPVLPSPQIPSSSGPVGSVLDLSRVPKIRARDPGALLARFGAASSRHRDRIRALSTTREGAGLASLARDGKVLLVPDAKGEQAFLRDLGGDQGRVLAFSPRAGPLLVGTESGEVLFLDPARGTIQRRLSVRPEILALGVVPSGSEVVVVVGPTRRQGKGEVSQSALLLLDVEDGTVRWKVEGVESQGQARVTPDGRYAVLLSRSRKLRIFDLVGKTEIDVSDLPEEFARSGAVTVAAGARWLVCGTPGLGLRLRDRERRLTLPSLPESQGFFRAIRVSPDGEWVAGHTEGEKGGEIRVWNLGQGKLRHRILVGEGSFLAFEFSGDGNWIAWGSGPDLRRLELGSGQRLPRGASHEGRPVGIASSPDGRWLATATDARGPYLWEARTGRSLSLPEGTREPQEAGLVFSPKGDALVGFSGTRVRRFEVPSGRVVGDLDLASRVPDPPGAGAWGIESLGSLQDGGYWIGYGNSRSVGAESDQALRTRRLRLVGGESWRLASDLSGRGLPLRQVVESNGGRVLLAFGADRNQRVRMTIEQNGSMREIPVSPIGDRASPLRGKLAPGGELLALLKGRRTVELWSIADGKKEKSVELPGKSERSFSALAWSPRSDLLAVTGSGDKVLILRGQTLEPLQELEGHREGSLASVFSPIGDYLATLGELGEVLVWDVEHLRQHL